HGPPQPAALAPPPSLPGRRRLARRVGRAAPPRLSPPDGARPGRGARGPHAAPARALPRPRPDPDGRRGRLAEPGRGREPAPLRGVPCTVRPVWRSPMTEPRPGRAVSCRAGSGFAGLPAVVVPLGDPRQHPIIGQFHDQGVAFYT